MILRILTTDAFALQHQNPNHQAAATCAAFDVVPGSQDSLDLVDVSIFAPRLPSLRVVLNHIGNVRITKDAPPADWRTGIQAAARHSHVFCKISALVEGAARDGQEAPRDLEFYRPYLDVVWGAFGDERVIYGSNWPVSERAADYETLQRIALQYAIPQGETATRRFCSANSKRAYKWG